jgi:hypothetical protein
MDFFDEYTKPARAQQMLEKYIGPRTAIPMKFKVPLSQPGQCQKLRHVWWR